MGKLQRLKSLSYLMALIYMMAYFTKRAQHQQTICNSDIISNQSGQLTPHLGQTRGEIFSEQGGAEKLKSFQLQNISECLCTRKWMYSPTVDSDGRAQLKRLNSSCSDEGTHYQLNQNVITYSMFYSEESAKLKLQSEYTSPLNYQIGLTKNLAKMREHYPGYSLRVYTSVPLRPHEHFCQLLCQNEDVFWCNIRKTPSHGDLSGMNFRTWRFLTMGDPTVNIFHSRDLDSLICHREAATVQDWLFNSGKSHTAIMAMRDHKGGHDFAMLAGMWGAENKKLLDNGEKIREKLILKSQPSTSLDKGFDQMFLASEIFYPMAKDILAYDSYHCVKWSNFTQVRPFPVQQKKPATDFVGNIFFFSASGKPSEWKVTECPLECRPSYGLDWIYC